MLPVSSANLPDNSLVADLQAQILHCLPQPALLLDAQLVLRGANLPGWQMLASGRPLLWQDGRLAGDRPSVLQSLREGILALLQPEPPTLQPPGPHPLQGPMPRRKLLSLMRPDRPEGRTVLQLFALHLASRVDGSTTGGLALLLLHDLGVRRTPDPAALAAAFELTPSEVRVATHIAAGASARQIANTHGVAMSTVRSQIRTVFDKVGVCRQSELAAALSALPTGW